MNVKDGWIKITIFALGELMASVMQPLTAVRRCGNGRININIAPPIK